MKNLKITKTSKDSINNNKSTNDNKDIARILDYYRMKCESFENERKDYLEKIEKIQLSQEEQHKNEWECKKRQDEVFELQNLLTQNNDILNKERRQMLIYQFELENKDHRSKEDRRRLMDLLKLAEPIEQTIKLYYDKRPDIKEKFAITDNLPISNYSKSKITNRSNIKSPISTSTKVTNNTKTLNKQIKQNYRISPSDEKQQVLKTIVLPKQKEEETLIQQEIEYLKKQIKQTRQFYEDQLRKMEESRRLKEEETKLTILAASERIDDLIKRNQKLERINYELTKDYMHLKYDSNQTERRLYEEMELTKLQNESLSITLKDISTKAQVDKELSKNDYERKKREVSSLLRNQLKSQEDHNALIKEQYKQVQRIYSQKLNEMEDKLNLKTQKLKIIENKRNNELEGFLNEIAQIRKRVKSYEDYIYKLKQYTHGNADLTNQINEDLKHNEIGFNQGASKLKDMLSNFENRLIKGEEKFQMNSQLDNQKESNSYNQNQFSFDENDHDNNNDDQEQEEQHDEENQNDEEEEQYEEEEDY